MTAAPFYGLFAQAGTLAKSNAETTAAKSARVAALMQDGYRRWYDGVTGSLSDAGRLAGGLGKARTPADLAALHREWLTATQARVTEGVQGLLDVSAKLAAEVAVLPTSVLPVGGVAVTVKPVGPIVLRAETIEDEPQPVAAVVVDAVAVDAVEVVVAPVEVAPVVVEAVAPAPEEVPVEAPAADPVVAEAVVVEAVAVEAPVVETVAESVVVAATPDAAPVEETVASVVDAAPVAAKPPVRNAAVRRTGGRGKTGLSR
ncbi:hypothetical protein [Azospirillum griseum]|uniref:hypothetical protein n=1 Tax=Azospirillum griseum TaxID=2496639 RepID=UPI001AECA36A|nr:hypothetical protein [Azospirillum griseum]